MPQIALPKLNKQSATLTAHELRRLAAPYPIGADDLIELQNTVYRVFTNQSDVILPGSLLGNYTSLQAATQNGVGGCATPICHSWRNHLMVGPSDM